MWNEFREQFVNKSVELLREHAKDEVNIASIALLEKASHEAVDYVEQVDGVAQEMEYPHISAARARQMAEAFALGWVTGWQERDGLYGEDKGDNDGE